jgi:hypothetical protein
MTNSCPICNAPLEGEELVQISSQASHGRQRVYCSPRCRQAAYRRRCRSKLCQISDKPQLMQISAEPVSEIAEAARAALDEILSRQRRFRGGSS